jgi:hypothetical protein
MRVAGNAQNPAIAFQHEDIFCRGREAEERQEDFGLGQPDEEGLHRRVVELSAEIGHRLDDGRDHCSAKQLLPVLPAAITTGRSVSPRSAGTGSR